ncbi:MAG: hypothetical protein IT381_23635 [Deltaproteobacteria bacterium]|nr:hypothetical protein [Deltaproteobacteria bacterium]
MRYTRLVLAACLASSCVRGGAAAPTSTKSDSAADSQTSGTGDSNNATIGTSGTTALTGPNSPAGPEQGGVADPTCTNEPTGAPAAIPSSAIALDVVERLGVARQQEMIRQGVPLGRDRNIAEASALAIVASDGRLVPAEFHVLSRWNGSTSDVTKPIKWVLVIFPANIGAHAAATYYLVTDQTNPAPRHALTATLAGNIVDVDTGLAKFRIDGTSAFASVTAWNDAPIVSASTQTARVDGANVAETTVRSLRIERSGPLSATIVVTGSYATNIGFTRRYELSACSKTARVRQAIAWETTSAVLLDRWRTDLLPAMPPPYAVTVQSDVAAPASQTTVALGETLALRQKQRDNRHQPAMFDVTGPGLAASGSEAKDSMLSVRTAQGALTIALDKMHRYEPQALRVLEDGHVAIDLADDHVWLEHHQGVFATYAVHASVAPDTRETLNRDVVAPLSAPLHAWPRAQAFAALGLELLQTSATQRAMAFDALVRDSLTKTGEQVTEKGIAGLMTFGFFPRLWGNALDGDELDCADGTPGAWDNVFWCTTWADYHNASMNSVTFAMRSGEAHWIDEIARPAALRTLHTSIMQCSPTDSWFYCGGAPAGYRGYRSDNNSSHQYFENLFHYYWLTGDSTVLTPLLVSATNIRNYYCAKRPAAACGADDPETDQWAGLVGRVPSQWNAVFAFLGQARDASFLDDWKGNTARAFTQRYVQGQDASARTLGFLGDKIGAAGQYSTDQLWMETLYDFENLHRLSVETDNAMLASLPPLDPRAIGDAWARTLSVHGPLLGWPNALFFSFSGARVGGSIVAVSANTSGSDPLLYTAGKADLAAIMMRAARRTGDATMLAIATSFVDTAIAEATAGQRPLGKVQALYLSRLHAAVALLENP